MVNPAFVFLPLYLYPYNSSSWSVATSAIAANPKLTFQIVVAPNLANIYPDSNYVAALENLNNYTNVQTLGYVATNWANRDIESVEADISSYAAWSNYSVNIAVQGIFFDEATAILSNDSFTYMSTLSAFAKSALGPGRRHVVFNPGVPVDASWYTIADTINIYENGWTSFNLSQLEANVAWDILGKSTVLIHNFWGGDFVQAELINNLTDANVGGLLVTTEDGYLSLSGLWKEFCEELADKDNGGDTTTGDVLPVDDKCPTVTGRGLNSEVDEGEVGGNGVKLVKNAKASARERNRMDRRRRRIQRLMQRMRG